MAIFFSFLCCMGAQEGDCVTQRLPACRATSVWLHLNSSLLYGAQKGFPATQRLPACRPGSGSVCKT